MKRALPCTYGPTTGDAALAIGEYTMCVVVTEKQIGVAVRYEDRQFERFHLQRGAIEIFADTSRSEYRPLV